MIVSSKIFGMASSNNNNANRAKQTTNLTLCKFFQHNQCTRGSQCQFLHMTLTEPRSKRRQRPQRSQLCRTCGGKRKLVASMYEYSCFGSNAYQTYSFIACPVCNSRSSKTFQESSSTEGCNYSHDYKETFHDCAD